MTEELDDAEARALREFGRLVARAKGLVAAVFVVAGIVVGGVAYWWVRDWQLARSGAHVPAMTAAFTLAPAFAVAYVLAYLCGRQLARARTDAWIDQVSRLHDVPRERLEEVARMSVSL